MRSHSDESIPAGLPSLLDVRALKHLDLFVFVLLDSVADTVLPELVSVLGHEKFHDFLDHFAGTTIRVPPKSVIGDSIHRAHLYYELERIDRTDPSAVSRVAKSYAMKPKTALDVHRRLHRLMSRVTRLTRSGR